LRQQTPFLFSIFSDSPQKESPSPTKPLPFTRVSNKYSHVQAKVQCHVSDENAY